MSSRTTHRKPANSTSVILPKLLLIGVAGTVLPLLTGNGIAADEQKGLQIAEKWCGACHSIGNEEPRQEDAGPLFEDLAKKDSTELLDALSRPHDFMPDDFPQLTDEDKKDLIAYIHSLR